MRVYEPPASRFAGRVPLLLTQKGEGRVHPSIHLARKRYKQKCILRAVSSLSATDRIYAEMI